MRASAALVALYALAVFLAAALLFGLEPMFGKMALPLLGGAPAVWNVALVFYQIALLAGYALAHLIAGRVRPRLQALAYVALVAVGLVVLPIRVAGGFRPDLSVVPIGPLFGLFSISLGLPFVALAAGSPLLQSWFARLPAVRGRDPYVLYAASNAGSLGALAAYPLAVEPYVGLRLQSATWAVVYALYLLLAGACGVALLRGAPADVESVARSANEPTLRLRSYWIALALVPSALMVAVTNHIETAVAAMPLLWTLPLGAYLLTFVIAFSGRPEQTRAIALRLRPYVLLPLVLLVSIGLALPAEWYVALSVVAFAVLALACHAELAATRPEASRLTEFYLLVALGGALGGSFVALFAPLALPTVAEYPLAIVAACALVAPAAKSDLRSRFLDLFLPALLAVLLLSVDRVHAGIPLESLERIATALAVVAVFAFAKRRTRFALGVLALFYAGAFAPNPNGTEIFRERNFFGVKTVLIDDRRRFHRFVHGSTVHGIEALDALRARDPLVYYARAGPLGAVFALPAVRAARNVGVVGLGVGAMACYRLAGQRWTFYEIDPAVEAIARDPVLFDYVPACGQEDAIVLGDARLALLSAPSGSDDVMFFDAYASDQPPVHLLTREALRLYRRVLVPGGVMAFHISNRFFDLRPVLGDLASDAGLVAFVEDFVPTRAEAEAGVFGSRWVVMSAAPASLAGLGPRWKPLSAAHRFPLWTDDYSSLLRVLAGP